MMATKDNFFVVRWEGALKGMEKKKMLEKRDFFSQHLLLQHRKEVERSFNTAFIVDMKFTLFEGK